MTLPTDLEDSKCFKRSDDDNINLACCIASTDAPCTLNDGEVGSQRTNIEHAKRHAVDVTLSLKSPNESVEFDAGGGKQVTEHEQEITVGPADLGNPGTCSFDIDVQQSDQVVVSEEVLEVDLKYEYHDSSRGIKSGPSVNPRVNLK